MPATIDLSHLAPKPSTVDESMTFVRALPDIDTIRAAAADLRMIYVLLGTGTDCDAVCRYSEQVPPELRNYLIVDYLPGCDLDDRERKMREYFAAQSNDWYAPASRERGRLP